MRAVKITRLSCFDRSKVYSFFGLCNWSIFDLCDSDVPAGDALITFQLRNYQVEFSFVSSFRFLTLVDLTTLERLSFTSILASKISKTAAGFLQQKLVFSSIDLIVFIE